MLRKLMTALMLVFVVVTVASCNAQPGNRGGVASTAEPSSDRESSRNSD
jgi:hypothetical protein